MNIQVRYFTAQIKNEFLFDSIISSYFICHFIDKQNKTNLKTDRFSENGRLKNKNSAIHLFIKSSRKQPLQRAKIQVQSPVVSGYD